MNKALALLALLGAVVLIAYLATTDAVLEFVVCRVLGAPCSLGALVDPTWVQ